MHLREQHWSKLFDSNSSQTCPGCVMMCSSRGPCGGCETRLWFKLPMSRLEARVSSAQWGGGLAGDMDIHHRWQLYKPGLWQQDSYSAEISSHGSKWESDFTWLSCCWQILHTVYVAGHHQTKSQIRLGTLQFIFDFHGALSTRDVTLIDQWPGLPGVRWPIRAHYYEPITTRDLAQSGWEKIMP